MSSQVEMRVSYRVKTMIKQGGKRVYLIPVTSHPPAVVQNNEGPLGTAGSSRWAKRSREELVWQLGARKLLRSVAEICWCSFLDTNILKQFGKKKYKCFSLLKQLPVLTGAYGNPAWEAWHGMKGQEEKCAVMIQEDLNFELTYVLQINPREVFNLILKLVSWNVSNPEVGVPLLQIERVMAITGWNTLWQLGVCKGVWRCLTFLEKQPYKELVLDFASNPWLCHRPQTAFGFISVLGFLYTCHSSRCVTVQLRQSLRAVARYGYKRNQWPNSRGSSTVEMKDADSCTQECRTKKK